MKTIEKTGKTVEEAVEAALAYLGATKEQVEIEVLEEPSKGLFGLIGSKAARVRVTLPDTPEEVAKDFLEKIFEKINIKVFIEVFKRDSMINISLSGKDLGILIGRRGETLDALQYLVNLAVAKKIGHKQRIVLDIEGYRKRREQTLVNLARRLSEKAKRTGHSVILEPMSPHERRIIHTALQNDFRVRTFSEGEEPYRKVIIAPKK